MDTIGAMIAGLIMTLILIYLAIALYGFVSFFEDLEHMLSREAA
jgi:hypothetical protein